MHKITNTFQMVFYAVLTTIVAMILTVIMITSVQPPHILEYTLYRAPVMAAFIAFPLMLFATSKIKLANELAEELERLVNRDALTGAATRDFFFSQFDEDRKASGVSLMVDIDHFKAINDTHGHFVGDTVIGEIARLLAQECRSHDVVCRFGGEEFAVFLYQVDVETGTQIAERMRAAIEAHEFTGTDGARFGVTVSIGMSQKAVADDIQNVLKAADRALYRAKDLGRNRTEAAVEPTS